MHYLLEYDAAPDYLERRGDFRGEHLAMALAARERGDLVLGGAVGDPVDGALLVFRTEESAKAFAGADPYVANGLVNRWQVRPWHTVVGEGIDPPKV